MKQYRLARDLFGMPKGTKLERLLERLNEYEIYYLTFKDGQQSLVWGYVIDEILADPETFEAIKWKPEYNEYYYLTEADGSQIKTNWENSKYDNDCYDVGNCYKTPEAEREMASKVNKLRLGVA